VLLKQSLHAPAVSTLANVYLFDGSTRLTDGSSVSGGSQVTFTNGSGLFTISGSRTISVKADLAGTAGETVGVMLTAVTLSGGSTVGGLPISGNQMSVAAATLASVAVGAPTPGTTTTDPSTGVTVWQSTFTVTTRDVTMSRLALRQINSAQVGDTANFKLLIDGAQVASQSSLDSSGYVTFSFSQLMHTGARDIKVLADVNNGSGRIIQMSLRTRADLEITDSQYGANLGTSTWITGTFPATTGTITINNGSLTTQKTADSTSANLVNAASSVSLGKWSLTAFGEPVKIDTLTASVTPVSNAGLTNQITDVTITGGSAGNSVITINGTPFTTAWGTSNAATATAQASAIGTQVISGARVIATNPSSGVIRLTSTPTTDGQTGAFTVSKSVTGDVTSTLSTTTAGVGVRNTALTLRNGQLYINGSQYGSTQTLTLAGVPFTVNYTVTPGTPVTVELKGDVFDNDSLGALNSNDTVKVTLKQGSANGTRQISFGTLAVPSGDVDANTLTVASGSISMSKQGNYANQSTVTPQTAYKLAAFNLSGNATEDINVNGISLDFASGGGGFPLTAVQNVSVKYGTTQTSPKSSVVASGNSYSVSFTLPKNTVMPVEVWGDITSAATSSTMTTSATVTGTTTLSSNSVTTGVIQGQQITATGGSLTVAVDGTSPVAALLADNTQVLAAAHKFSAVSDSYTITDLTYTVTANTSVTNVSLMDGGTAVQTQPVGASNIVTFSGLSIPVAAGSTKVLGLQLNLGTVGVGNGTSGEAITVTLTSEKANKGSGGQDVQTGLTLGAAVKNAFRAVPTITNITPFGGSGTLSTGTLDIAKFTVNTNGTGPITWSSIKFAVAKSANPTIATVTGETTGATASLWDADSNTNIPGAVTTAGLAAGAGTGSLIFTATTEQEVSGAKNYVLRAVIGGSVASTDSINTNIPVTSTTVTDGATLGTTNDAATLIGTGSNFVWSDESASLHTTSTKDWYSDYLVKNLPNSTQNLRP
jgi:hypothetical protein